MSKSPRYYLCIGGPHAQLYLTGLAAEKAGYGQFNNAWRGSPFPSVMVHDSLLVPPQSRTCVCVAPIKMANDKCRRCRKWVL